MKHWLIGGAAALGVIVVASLGFVVGSLWTTDQNPAPLSTTVAAREQRSEEDPSAPAATVTTDSPQSPRAQIATVEPTPVAASDGKNPVPETSADAGNRSPAGGESTSPAPKPMPETLAQKSDGKADATPAPDMPAEPPPAAGPVVFQPVSLDEPATSFEMSEDGNFLIITHQAANRVSVYDTQAGKVLKTMSTEAPRAVICRNGHAYVANFGKGTISVFSQARQWARSNELQVDKAEIMYLSAAGGRNFQNELLVTCHPGGVFLVDVKKDRCQPLIDKAMATVSDDGKLVFTQDSFNQSPSGLISAWPYAEFLTRQRGAPMFQGGIQQTPFVYQVHPGGYWLCENMVFGGVPIGQVRDNTGGLLIPDYAQKVVYNLTPDVITSHRLNTSFEEFAKRKVELPAEIKKDFSRLNHLIYRRRDYLLDHPAALTRGKTLDLYVLDIKQGNLLTARTAAFAEPSAAAPEEPLVASTSATAPGSPGTPSASSELSRPEPSGSSAKWLEDFPRYAIEGRPFAFALPADIGKVELMDGPTGMKLSPDRRLVWTPTPQQLGPHELKIGIEQDGQSSFERPSVEVVDQALVDAAGGDLSKLDQFSRLDLAIDHLAIRRGSDGKSLLLLQGDSLRILGPDGISVVQEHKLPERYHDVRDREDVFVLLSKSPPAIDVVDKKSLRRIQHQPIKAGDLRVLDVMDFAIHPTKPVSYVAIKHDIELPRYTVIVVNERNGRVEVPGILGTFVEVDPQGKTLYTGYKDIYERGRKFHVNPNWSLVEIPQYGSVDMLISWDLSRSEPKIRQLIRQAGGNGYGIRLSPDGARITYLSHVGHPPFTNNLVGFSAKDFDDAGIMYETKGRGTTHDLDYHPSLPWLATPAGSGGAVLFHRETGQHLEQRLLITSQGAGKDPVERVFFAPDGKSITLLAKGGETGRYLRRIGLRLDRSERARTDLEPVKPKPPVETPRPKIPAADLHALQIPDKMEPLTVKEIGKRYLDTVVDVLSDEGSGTGFVVGQDGYILTCAHVLPTDGSIEVQYPYPKGDETETVRTKATVVATDEKRDIALLKIRTRGPLPHVWLSPVKTVDSGEAVTVIGNPGLGGAILSHTMTTGIVSNPDREIEGQHYIQTSAAINPGNSGGPMFDSVGHVVGLVSLKGQIEGAGFAVPAHVLRDFLGGLLAQPTDKATADK